MSLTAVTISALASAHATKRGKPTQCERSEHWERASEASERANLTKERAERAKYAYSSQHTIVYK